MSGIDEKIITTLIGAFVTFVGYKFTQKKDKEKNSSDEQNVIVEKYVDTLTRINELYGQIDTLMKERNGIQRDFDKFASVSNAKILELERQLKSANENIYELLETVKEKTEELNKSKKINELGGITE